MAVVVRAGLAVVVFAESFNDSFVVATVVDAAVLVDAVAKDVVFFVVVGGVVVVGDVIVFYVDDVVVLVLSLFLLLEM